MSEPKDYKVREDGFILGDYYKACETITLRERQAKYLLPPHGTRLEPGAAPAAVPAAPFVPPKPFGTDTGSD